MTESRPPWFLLTGLIVGLAIGLLFSWVLVPVEAPADPLTLRADFKDQYRALIAAAYVANGDLGRAQARLALLGDPDPARTLASQAQVTLGQGGSEDTVRALGILAAALEGRTFEDVTPTPQVALSGSPGLSGSATPTRTPGPTATPSRTPTPLATRTPTPTQGLAFILQDLAFICDPNLIAPLIQVLAFDAAGQPVPGVEVVITWDGGQETFFTGLKPDIGLGYADYEMTVDVLYTIRLTDGGEPVSGLTPVECEGEEGARFWGSWRVTFVQPGP